MFIGWVGPHVQGGQDMLYLWWINMKPSGLCWSRSSLVITVVLFTSFFFPPWQLTAIAGDAIFPKPASLINYDLQASKLTSVRWTEMKSWYLKGPYPMQRELHLLYVLLWHQYRFCNFCAILAGTKSVQKDGYLLALIVMLLISPCRNWRIPVATRSEERWEMMTKRWKTILILKDRNPSRNQTDDEGSGARLMS